MKTLHSRFHFLEAPVFYFSERPDRVHLQAFLVQARAKARRVVMTCGCFDLLGAHHVEFLRSAATGSNPVIVALNDDDSVRRLKGLRRPVYPLCDRITLLRALRSVSAVIVFEEDTPEKVIEFVKPYLFVKGGITGQPTTLGSQFAERGERRLARWQGSTTETLARIHKNNIR